MNRHPLVEEVSTSLMAPEAFELFKDRPFSFFLDSGMDPEKLGHKVSWPELSHALEAVYLPTKTEGPFVGGSLTVPIQTTYFLRIDSEAIGHIVAAWLNSLAVRAYAASFAERARGAYFRHFSWVIGLLPLPGELQQVLEGDKSIEGVLADISALSEALHAKPNHPDRAALEGELDVKVAELYGLDAKDVEALRQYYAFISTAGSVEPSGEPKEPELDI